MNQTDFPAVVERFQNASNEMLAAVLDQSVDCIKVIGPAGSLDYMNRNGRCAMEIDDFAHIAGKSWWDLWPEDARSLIHDAIARAKDGRETRFEAFCPTAKGNPRWWDVSVSPLTDGRGEFQGLVSSSRDITDQVNARELRDATSAEMRHRLMNAYTLTGAIILATARGSPERETFAREVVDRLHRLGIAQMLLMEGETLDGAELGQLIQRLVEPFGSDRCPIDIDNLPEVTANEQQARALALVFGELSTNSSKYGAMGHGGRVAVRGRVVGGVLALSWSETAELPVESHQRDGGAGFALIRRTLASQNGSFDIAWRKDGLEVTCQLPGF